MHVMQRITDQLTLVCFDIRIWSGRKKLRAEDLKLGTEIPPEELVSLGSKRVCNPEALRVFHRVKKAAERACLLVGTRFLGGFAVAAEHAEAVADKLDALKSEFDTETGSFLAGYNEALEDWIASLPQWEAPIRRAIEPVNVVGGRMKFGFQLLLVGPATRPGTLQEEVRSLGDGIFAEVGQMARELDESFLGKEKLHRRALGTFVKIREKLACLSFVDPRIQPVVDTIDDWAARLPLEGPIEGAMFNEGYGLAMLLGDAQRLALHSAGQMAVQQGLTPTGRDEPSVPDAPTAVVASAVSFEDELDALFGPAPPVLFTADAPQHPVNLTEAVAASDQDLEDPVDAVFEQVPPPAPPALEGQSFFF
jgi:hypothetical protein